MIHESRSGAGAPREDAGDPAALGGEAELRRLMARRGEALLRLAAGLLGDWEEARDACQETWIAVWRNRGLADPGRPLWPWLLSIHLNGCRSRLRRRRLRRWLRLDEGEAQRLPAPPPALEDDGEETRARLAAVLALSARLSPRQREALLLVDLEGLDSVEAARVLDCRPSTLRVQLSRARARLRTWLAEDGWTIR